jgi:hypothetical protein
MSPVSNVQLRVRVEDGAVREGVDRDHGVAVLE